MPAAPAPVEAPRTPLLSVVMQGDAQVALLEQLIASESAEYFIAGHDLRQMTDAELGLTPGTLGRRMADAIGKPPEIFAGIPHLVTLVTFSEGTVPSNCGDRLAQVEHLTALGRIAAASSATRALVLYEPDRILTPDDFLKMSAARPEQPLSALMIWVNVRNAGGELSTRGLAAFGLPEARLSIGSSASAAEINHGTDVLLTLGVTMLGLQTRVADGFQIGKTWEARFDGEKFRVEKRPFFKRLFQ